MENMPVESAAGARAEAMYMMTGTEHTMQAKGMGVGQTAVMRGWVYSARS